jgi:translation elongation factor EF-G
VATTVRSLIASKPSSGSFPGKERATPKTDFLAPERGRGIITKSAVVSFVIGDVTVNLTDTPVHPDLVAEVERW